MIDSKLLIEKQGWSLEHKIDHSLGVIDQFASRFGGEDRVFISFSGGKDSTVLFHLAKVIYPNIKACFVNTYNEYPEIVKFVRKLKDSGENIDIIYPKKKMKEIFEEYGFPIISKEVSSTIEYVRSGTLSDEYIKKILSKKGHGGIPAKYIFLLNEDFNISGKCCYWLKKKPMMEYAKKTKRKPIVGDMADESYLRGLAYLQRGGCNSFNRGKEKSHPLSIWKEKDIYDYIEKYNVEISPIYNELKRTGCMMCGFGLGLDNSRLKYLEDKYPKAIDMIGSFENNGISFKEAIQKCGLYEFSGN